MDEEVIKDLFDRATSLGYKKGIEDFKNLISSDNDVLQDNFNYVKENGYSKGIEDFSSLLGIGQVKKKENSEVTSQTADTDSPTQQVEEESTSVESLPEETPRVSRIKETGEYLAPSAYMPEGRKLVPVQEKEPVQQQEPSDIESVQDDSMLVQEKDYTFTDTVGPEKSDKADVSTLAEKQIQNDIYKQEQELRYKELTGGKSIEEQREIKRKQLEAQKDSDQFEEAVYLIDDYLLNNEENASADLNKAFEQSGFYFGEANVGRNALEVISADGERIIVDYSTAGLDEDSAESKILAAENKIKDFVTKKRVDSEIAYDISRGVKTGESIAKEKNLLTKKDYEKEEKEWKSKLSNFQSGVDEYKKMAKSLSSFEPKTEQDIFIYNNSVEKLNALSEKLKKEGEDIEAAKGEHDALVGRYIDYEGDKWDWSSLALREFSTGIANITAAGGRVKADATEMLSKWVGSLSGSEEFGAAGKLVSEMTRADIDRKKSQFQKDLDYLGTTSEAVAKLQESSIVARGIIGGLQSAPAMLLALTGVGSLTVAAAGLQTYESLDEEFKQFEGFEELPIEEKIAVKGAISLAVGFLEKLGIDDAISRTGLVSKLIRKATKDLPKDASELMIKNAFSREASKLVKFLSKKGKQTVGLAESMAVSATSEGFTGSSQEVVETGIKYAYNKAKHLEVFKTPETFTEFMGNVGTAGIEEMIGSVFLGGTGHVVRAYSNNKIKELPSETFEIFDKMSSDENFSSMFSDALKTKIINKEISKEEAQKQLDNYHEAKSVLKEIPKDYTSDQRKEAFELLSEKKKKEAQIQGISPALAFPITEEIKKIDEELKSISSKTDADYVQDKIEVLEAERKKALEVNKNNLNNRFREGSELTVEEFINNDIDKKIAEVKKVIDKPVTLKEKAVSLMDRAKGIFTKTEAPAQPEVAEVEQTTVEAPAQTEAEVQEEVVVEPKTTSEVEAKKADIERRREEELDTKLTTSISRENGFENNLDSNQELIFKIGSKHNIGNNVVSTYPERLDFRSDVNEDGYSIVGKTVKPTIKTDGVITSSGEVEIATFDSKAEAEAWVAEQKKLDKNKRADSTRAKKINAKYDAELAALESATKTTAEVEAKKVETTAEVEAEVESEVFAEEVVYEMDKTNRKTWSKDFEIIDNRNGLELGPVEENGKWAVRNKVTGEMVEAQTKKDAQNIIANAPAYAEMFGDGAKVEADMLITPSTKTTTEVEAEVQEEVEAEVQEEVVVEPKTTAEVESQVQEEVQEDISIEDESDFLINLFTEEQETTKETAKVPKKEIDSQVENAKKALSKVAPEVEIIVPETEAEYKKATKEGRNQNSGGTYVGGKIYINPNRANKRTVAHEVFHALLLSKGRTDQQAQAITERMMEAVKKNADQELLDRLEEFSSKYENALQSEESIAELMGILAEGYPKLNAEAKSLIKRWLDRLAKIFGIKPLTSDADIINFLNTVSGKIASGQDIELEDIKVLGDIEEGESSIEIKKANQRFQSDFTDTVSGMTYLYDKNSEKFKKLEADGYINREKSISDFNDKYVFFHQPDAAFSGSILKDGKLLVEGKGGMYYPIKFHDDGYFWASTENAATKMASDLNKVLAQNEGTIYMALTAAPYDKLLSSTTAANAVLDFFTSKILDENFSVTKKEIDSSIKKSLLKVNKTKKVTKESKDKKTGKITPKKITTKIVGLSLDKPIVINGDFSKVSDKLPSSVNKKIKEGFNKIYVKQDLDATLSNIKKVLSPDNSSFGGRKEFAENLIAEMADVIKSKKTATKQFSELFSEGIQNKYFKGITKTGKSSISKSNMIQALSEMLTEPILKDGIDRKKGGQIYAIIELNSPVKPVDSDKHESYPKALKATEGKVKINILTDRKNWYDVTEDFETNDIVTESRRTRIYPTSGVSVQGLKINTSKSPKASQSRKQISWEVSREGKGDPSISKRNEVVSKAADDLKNGKISNEEWTDIVKKNSPITKINRFFEPATDERMKEALGAKADKLNNEIGDTDGGVVGLRLDIPAYKNKNTWVVSVHDGPNASGKVVSYRNVAKIRNVNFSIIPLAALNIASGKVNKTSVARMYGEWVEYDGKDSNEQAENAKAEVNDIINDKNWVQIGMNPFRHSFFYDRSSEGTENMGRPVEAAEEVVQIGGLVYAKNPVYGNITDDTYIVKNKKDSKGEPVRFQKKGKPSIAEVRRVAKEKGIRESAVVLALKKLGYTDAEISGKPKAAKPKATKSTTGNQPKSFVNRAFLSEGINERSRKKLKELGLDYTVESQSLAQKNAEKIIEEIGIEQAYKLAKEGQIRGGARTWIKAQMFEELNERAVNASVKGDTELAEALSDELALIMDEFSDEQKMAGQEAAMLNRIYQNFNMKYDVKMAKKSWKRMFEKDMPAEVEARLEAQEKKINELNEKTKELEEKIGSLEEQEAVENLKENVKRGKKGKPSESSLKNAAELLRKAKFTKSINQLSQLNSSATGLLTAAWDGAVEVVAITLEKSGSIEQAVKSGIASIKSSDWYKGLSKKNKKIAEKRVENDFNEFLKRKVFENDIKVSEEGDIDIDPKFLYELVESGVDNISDLTDAVYDRISDKYPGITKREVRDAITKYGKQSRETKDEILLKINKIRTDGKQISAIEDLLLGKRPKRSNKPRKITDEQRERIRQIRELLKELPEDDSADRSRFYKTALEGYKKRVKNRITDLENAIKKNERIVKEKRSLKLDQETKDLIKRKEELQKEYDSTFGKTPKSDETILREIVNRKEKTLRELEVRLEYVKQEGKDMPKSKKKELSNYEIERLNSEIKQKREELNDALEETGVAEAKRIERMKSYSKKRIAELRDKVARKDFSKRSPKKVKYDKELIAIKKKLIEEKVKFDMAFEKQQYKEMGILGKTGHWIYRAFGTFKGLKATADLSAMLRQGILLGSANPKEFAEATAKMHKFAFSSKMYKDFMAELEASDDYVNMIEDGVSITDTSGDVLRSEERFVGTLIEKIPLFGSITKGSERAYGGFLNVLRVSVYRKIVKAHEDMGITRENNPKAYKNIAKFVNNATGRGAMTSDRRFAKLLNAVFFSPRMISGMFGLIRDLGRKDSTPYLKKQAAKSLLTFIGYQTAMKYMIMSAAMLLLGDDEDDFEMDMNPVSTDFNKLKKFDTRYDVSAGWGIAARTLARFISNMKSSGPDAEIKSFDELRNQNRYGEVGNYLFNKLSPLTRQIYNVTEGKHPSKFMETNEDATKMDYIKAFAVPLTITELMDGIDEGKPSSEMAFNTILTIYGVGVQDYESTSSKPKKSKPKKLGM